MAVSSEHRRTARQVWAQQRAQWQVAAADALDDRDAARFLARVERWYADAFEPLSLLYGQVVDVGDLVDELLDSVLGAAAARPHALRLLDDTREIDPEWFLDESMVGYVCYADRFAGDLTGIVERIDYLRDLGVTYLHLMPVLAPREGPSDGGYAVADYRAVDPALGTMQDLRRIAATLRDHGISLCVDLVVNHTAREHEWARKAIAGEQAYRDYYLMFPDRTLPDAFEEHLPEVFPDRAPGNFTWVDVLDAWVWTTFHDYQWDLNYANPVVFAEMLAIICDLANVGVEIFRLDAVPFTWKRMGTNCQNQPEAHLLLQALRALVRIAAPAVLFKAEAIVTPDDLVQYLGAHDLQRHECELAYHNQLMVLLWSSAASRDARLATHALRRMRTPPPATTWMTYLRCHDDIGWAITGEDAAAVGVDEFDHRAFLIDFHAGEVPGTYARGERFGFNPVTLDARTSGTAASLAGIEQALERDDDTLLPAAISRMLALYATLYGWGGIPLIYMGDEIGVRNDYSYHDDPAHAGDNRWMHRPRMDWQAAARRRDAATVEGRLFSGFRRLAASRAATPQLQDMGATTTPLHHDNPHTLAWLRRHPRFGGLLGITNFDDVPQSVDADLCADARLGQPRDVLGIWPMTLRDGRIHLPALSTVWLTDG
ncbi:MAG: alpha-amylase family protein [Actinobacteria bacterium]|nr:alpha-amylase family protein [Actinomycetota bacterium]